MADIFGINNTEILADLWSSAPADFINSIGFIINIGKAISIAILVYVIFLIVGYVIKIIHSLRVKSIEKNVAEINVKLDRLVNALDKKHSKR